MHSFDGHNDVLLRLWRHGPGGVEAFLDGDTKGQLDLPRAQKGGMVGGLFAIFVPSESARPSVEPTDTVPYDGPLPLPTSTSTARRAGALSPSSWMRLKASQA